MQRLLLERNEDLIVLGASGVIKIHWHLWLDVITALGKLEVCARVQCMDAMKKISHYAYLLAVVSLRLYRCAYSIALTQYTKVY
jgi:hypothetical protein